MRPWSVAVEVNAPLDWHNKIFEDSIRLCCGQNVLERLMVQIDNYSGRTNTSIDSISGDRIQGLGLGGAFFKESGFEFGFINAGLPFPDRIRLTIRRLDKGNQ
jgi:hypothetical protein